MELVNSNLASLFQVNKTGTKMDFNSILNNMLSGRNVFNNDIAFSMVPEMSGRFENFDAAMSNIAMLSGIVDSAKNGVSEMFQQGSSIKDLLERAKEEGLSDESLKAIQDEVQARIKAIQDIRENTRFNEINPFDGPISLNIPDWQNLFGTKEEENGEEEKGELAQVLASFKFDMSMIGDKNGKSYNIGATATVEIGYTEDGALQITVDASMDFDLSGIMKNGVQSDDSMDIINQFLSLLMGKQNDLGQASDMLNSFFASGSASIVGDGFAIDATNDINFESQSSETLKGQIVQHAKITLDSTANQCPSIAINLL